MRTLDPSQFEVVSAPTAPAAAPSGGPRVLDPNQFEVVEAPTVGQSAARGALQGASLGFGDEIAAAIDTGVSKIPGLRSLAQHLQPSDLPAVDNPALTYEQRRDAYRQKNAAASKENPIAYGAGEVAGGLATSVVPVGGAVKGAGVLANAARGAEAGAVLGAASGLGSSEATSFSGQIRDALHGAAGGGIAGGVLGGVTGALGKAAAGATERVDRYAVSGLAKGAKPGTRASIAEAAADVAAASREFGGLDKLAPDARKVAAKAAQSKVGNLSRQVYGVADEIQGGVSVPGVTSAMRAVEKELDSNPATKSLARRVEQQIKDAAATWGDHSDAKVPAAEVRKFVTSLQKSISGADIDPSVGKQVSAKLSGAVKDVLDGYVAGAAKRAPDAETRALLEKLPQLNRQQHALKLIADGAKKAAQGEALKEPGVGGFIQKLGQHDGLKKAAADILHGAVAPATRGADSMLAKVIAAKRGGAAGPALVQQAIQIGFPRSVAERIAAALATEAPQPEAQP